MPRGRVAKKRSDGKAPVVGRMNMQLLKSIRHLQRLDRELTQMEADIKLAIERNTRPDIGRLERIFPGISQARQHLNAAKELAELID